MTWAYRPGVDLHDADPMSVNLSKGKDFKVRIRESSCLEPSAAMVIDGDGFGGITMLRFRVPRQNLSIRGTIKLVGGVKL